MVCAESTRRLRWASMLSGGGSPMTPKDILTVVTSSTQEAAFAATEVLANRW